jgi:hypothetical protein
MTLGFIEKISIRIRGAGVRRFEPKDGAMSLTASCRRD